MRKHCKKLLREIFLLQKWAVWITDSLKTNESYRNSVRKLKIMTLSSVFIHISVRYEKGKSAESIITNYDIHIYHTCRKDDMFLEQQEGSFWNRDPTHEPWCWKKEKWCDFWKNSWKCLESPQGFRKFYSGQVKSSLNIWSWNIFTDIWVIMSAHGYIHVSDSIILKPNNLM
jgi:hypothetical protein